MSESQQHHNSLSHVRTLGFVVYHETRDSTLSRVQITLKHLKPFRAKPYTNSKKNLLMVKFQSIVLTAVQRLSLIEANPCQEIIIL